MNLTDLEQLRQEGIALQFLDYSSLSSDHKAMITNPPGNAPRLVDLKFDQIYFPDKRAATDPDDDRKLDYHLKKTLLSEEVGKVSETVKREVLELEAVKKALREYCKDDWSTRFDDDQAKQYRERMDTLGGELQQKNKGNVRLLVLARDRKRNFIKANLSKDYIHIDWYFAFKHMESLTWDGADFQRFSFVENIIFGLGSLMHGMWKTGWLPEIVENASQPMNQSLLVNPQPYHIAKNNGMVSHDLIGNIRKLMGVFGGNPRETRLKTCRVLIGPWDPDASMESDLRPVKAFQETDNAGSVRFYIHVISKAASDGTGTEFKGERLKVSDKFAEFAFWVQDSLKLIMDTLDKRDQEWMDTDRERRWQKIEDNKKLTYSQRFKHEEVPNRCPPKGIHACKARSTRDL